MAATTEARIQQTVHALALFNFILFFNACSVDR